MGEQFQGGRLAARALKAEGVDAVFTLSGGHVMPIYEGCRLEGIRVVDVRHEQAAAHAAEAWGRMRRACGVAVATAGPGVTGTVTAVANSFVAQTPLVVIGGARPLAQAEQRALQELDQLSLLRPITKWAALCTDAERIPELVVAGSGIWWEGAWKQLGSFAENGRLPVFLSGSARGALPPDHDLFFQHARGVALETADVVCVIGAPLDFRLGFGRFTPDAKLVHVHADSAEIGRNRAPDAGIVGDCAAVLGILADGVKLGRAGEREAWLARLGEAEAAWGGEHRAQIESDAAPIHHYRLRAQPDP